MKKIKLVLILFMLSMFTVSCSLIKTYTVRSPKLNSIIGKNLDSVTDMGLASLETKHLGSVIKNKKIYTTVKFSVDSVLTTVSGIIEMSYVLKYNDNKIYVTNLELEKVMDESGKSYPVDMPLYKIPLNIVAKNVLSQEIYDLNNINLPLNKKVTDIEMQYDSIIFHLVDK